MVILILAVLAVAMLVVAVNINHRLAYSLYCIPKVHYIVKLICFRNKQLLEQSKFYMPIPIHPAIDDLGWQQGKDLRKQGGPSRLIVNRNPGIEEYAELVKISQKSGCRLIGLFVMSELDLNNICGEAEYNRPIQNSDITEYGIKWSNAINSVKYNNELMQFIKKHSSNIEFGMHGIRHEHFDQNGMTNAEWASRKRRNSVGGK